jgi:hypothetical protein
MWFKEDERNGVDLCIVPAFVLDTWIACKVFFRKYDSDLSGMDWIGNESVRGR